MKRWASKDRDAQFEFSARKHPKATWSIADAKRANQLRLDSTWHGELDVKDPVSMTHFWTYVIKKCRINHNVKL